MCGVRGGEGTESFYWNPSLPPPLNPNRCTYPNKISYTHSTSFLFSLDSLSIFLILLLNTPNIVPPLNIFSKFVLFSINKFPHNSFGFIIFIFSKTQFCVFFVIVVIRYWKLKNSTDKLDEASRITKGFCEFMNTSRIHGEDQKNITNKDVIQ